MKKTYLLLIASLLFLSHSLVAQLYEPIPDHEQVDKEYIFNPVKEEAKAYKEFRKKKLSKSMSRKYSYSIAYGKQEAFSSGQVYLNWKEMESYLNTLLYQGDSTAYKRQKTKVYIAKVPEINAYCLYDGTMMVNVGLMAEVKDEAALIAVMGHEIAHFQKKHLVKRLVDEAENKHGKELDLKLGNAHTRQQHELEADSLGFEFTFSNGFDLNSANSNFELFLRESEYTKKRAGGVLESSDSIKVSTDNGDMNLSALQKLLSTHPDDRDRMNALGRFIGTHPGKKGVSFKINESLFRSLQNRARLETVAILFTNNNYRECLERAFIYHLYQPEEITYSYYITECIRRLCYLKKGLRYQGFLTEYGAFGKFKKQQGILHDLSCIVMDSVRLAGIQSPVKTQDSVKAFETYEDAFWYFSKQLEEKNIHEAKLLQALFEKDKTKRSEYLKTYLAFSDAQHKAYAAAYQNDNLQATLLSNTKEMILIDDIYFRSNGSGTIHNHKVFPKKGLPLSLKVGEGITRKYTDVETISLTQLATEDLNRKNQLLRLFYTMYFAKKDQNNKYGVGHYYQGVTRDREDDKTDIFLLAPEIWDFFNEHDLHSFSKADFQQNVHYGSIPYTVLVTPFAPWMWFFFSVKDSDIEYYTFNSSNPQINNFSAGSRKGLGRGTAKRLYRSVRKQSAWLLKYN